jgi:hypothetical protein
LPCGDAESLKVRFRRALLPLGLSLTVLVGLVVDARPSAAAGRTIPCLPVSGIGSATEAQARQFMTDGKLTIPGYPAVAIGTSGNVNWGIDPFHDTSWRRLFLSLKWLDKLTAWYARQPVRDADMLNRALAYAGDFARDNPAGGGPRPADAWTGMYAGQRATVYTCLDALRPGSTRAALLSHGTWLNDPAHDPGAWNQGVDTYIGLLAAGCVYGSTTWADHATTRLNQLVSQTIGSDGSITEQAPGYGDYLNRRWEVASQVLTQCGRAVPANLASRRTALLSFLAWTTEPSGNVAQLGDSLRAPVPLDSPGVIGSPLEWAASRGTQGTAPTALSRSFSTGWGFARSSWNPFTSATWFSLRWGPGRALHGHDDHQQVLLDALGHQVLVDSGHYGYTSGAYRDFLRSPFGHNVLTLPGVAFSPTAATTLTYYGGAASWRWYEVKDTAYAGRARLRSTLVDTAVPLVVVFDRASRPTAGSFQQLWHLPPGTTVTVPQRNVARGLSADGKVRTTIVQLPLAGQTFPAGSTGVVTGRTSPYQGWVSYANGSRTAAPTVIASRSGTSASMLTVVVPTVASVTPGIGITRGSDGVYRISVRVGAVTRVIKVTTAGVLSE